MAESVDITFTRLAVLPAQIRAMKLPTRPTKPGDSRAAGFDADSVELDAINPNVLREIVRNALRAHLPDDRMAELEAEERAEKASLLRWRSGGRGTEPGKFTGLGFARPRMAW